MSRKYTGDFQFIIALEDLFVKIIGVSNPGKTSWEKGIRLITPTGFPHIV